MQIYISQDFHEYEFIILAYLIEFSIQYLHFSKTSLDEPLDVHLCSYFHEHHCVTRRDVIQTWRQKHEYRQSDWTL